MRKIYNIDFERGFFWVFLDIGKILYGMLDDYLRSRRYTEMEYQTFYTEGKVGIMAFTRLRKGKRIHDMVEVSLADYPTTADAVSGAGVLLNEKLVSEGKQAAS